MIYLEQESKKWLWATAAFAVLSVGFQVSDWVRSHMPWWTYRFLAGLLLGMLAAFAYVILKYLIRKIKAKDFAAFGTNLWDRGFTIFAYFFILALGLIIWFVGWEGKNTGWVYGLGVLVGGFFIDAGVGSLVASEDNPNHAVKRTATPPLT